MLICCIRLLCDWSFRFCHCIIYICYFVESYLFSLWYDWFLLFCAAIWRDSVSLFLARFILSLLLIKVFHISVSWWSFTGDWVTASLLKSPGLFSVFWPFSIMLLFGWSPLGRQLLNLPGIFNNPLVTMPKAPITISIIVTFMFQSFFNSLARSRYLYLFSHSFSFIANAEWLPVESDRINGYSCRRWSALLICPDKISRSLTCVKSYDFPKYIPTAQQLL